MLRAAASQHVAAGQAEPDLGLERTEPTRRSLGGGPPPITAGGSGAEPLSARRASSDGPFTPGKRQVAAPRLSGKVQHTLGVLSAFSQLCH
jgi:hypothetical protein